MVTKMIQSQLSSLKLSEWKGTRDTLQKYAQMVGTLRESLSTPHPHWWHISLRVSKNGLTTTTLPRDKEKPGETFEVVLDLVNHHLLIESNFRESKTIKLTGQSLSALCEETCSLVSDIGINIPIKKERFDDGKAGEYDETAVEEYWKSLKEVHRILNTFRSTLRQERSPIQLWPHHFDLAMSWFSGRLIPGKDPNDAEASKEQMMFGFSTGDDSIPDPYIYITAYPVPDGFPNFEMPGSARWFDEGFRGGVLMYEDYINSMNPEFILLNYLRTFQKAGAALMK
jgi:hypothetical protein